MVYLCKRHRTTMILSRECQVFAAALCSLQDMTILKRIALLVAIISVSARPLVKIFLRSLASAPDDDIGEIPILSTSELSSFVKGSELFYHALAHSGARFRIMLSTLLISYMHLFCIFISTTHSSVYKRTHF